MTFYYRTHSWSSSPHTQPAKETIDQWKHLSDKANWRITQLPNGFYQAEVSNPENEEDWHDVTRRETMKGVENAIDGSIDHYNKKLEATKGPKVVKTFK